MQPLGQSAGGKRLGEAEEGIKQNMKTGRHKTGRSKPGK
jgi:hypothetical protein